MWIGGEYAGETAVSLHEAADKQSLHLKNLSRIHNHEAGGSIGCVKLFV